MRTIRALFLLALVSAALVFQVSASEIKIQIVDTPFRFGRLGPGNAV